MQHPYRNVGFESLTISDSAVALTGGVATALSFKGKVEDAAVRMRGDGTEPTTTVGELLAVGDIVILGESDIKSMQFIRVTGTDGVLQGHYFSSEPAGLAGA